MVATLPTDPVRRPVRARAFPAFLGLLLAALAALLGGCAATPVLQAPPRAVGIVPVQAARPVVALVLGSGGSRGFAHVGVIKVLEGAGIRPGIVVGASSGALVAALYAGGADAAADRKSTRLNSSH